MYLPSGRAGCESAGRPSAPDLLTLDVLRATMPTLSEARTRLLLPHLEDACWEASITTPLRLAAFLAQTGHESVDLRFFEELADGRAYEGRRDLGNIHPGDGPRFKGRGPLQLTGRENYLRAGLALGLDLIATPQLVATPEVGFRTTHWFWNRHKLNELADIEAFDSITVRINGGRNGKPDRDKRYARARSVLGI